MNENDQHRLHAFIKGRVQGVGFRYYTLQTAQDYHLTGWVRNLHDGRVEVVAEGAQPDLNNFLRDMRKGPISADVEDVDYAFKDARGEFDKFRVRMTA
jgi:acylphosphatase